MESNTSQSLDMVGVVSSILAAPTNKQELAKPDEKSGQQVASESDLPEFDAEGQAEFDAIASMIAEAAKQSLQVEVVHSFGCYRAAGADVVRASKEALYDWDI